MTKKTKRTDAQRAAEAAYMARHEVIQVNVKWKKADDVAMFKRLRERFDGESDSAIVRIAVKELAAKRGRNAR